MISVGHVIKAYDVLPGGSLKPSALLRAMQDAAAADVAVLGADYDKLRESDMIFVVNKIAVSLKRPLRTGECLGVRTWNSGTAGVCFVRSYAFNVGGECLGEAASRWVLLSCSSRRILRPDSLSVCVITNPDEAPDIQLSRRIKLPENASVVKSRYRAALTDTDANRHVSNTRYGDLIVDFSGADFDGKFVKEFEIHFLSELRAGEEIDISAASARNRSFLTARRGETPVFSASLALFDK